MKKVIVIVGPTASGKSNVSVRLAKELHTEIISGDSVQVYRSLNIGSAKITEEEMEGIKHHLIDILNPTEDYSVASFQANARKLIDEITSKGMTPIICGGTGFYIKAALYDYDFSKEERHNHYSNLSNEEIRERLLEYNDPEIPDINNRKRLERHLELYESGEEISLNKNEPLYDSLIIGLTMDRETLYERINMRVDKMVQDGLIDEVKSLYDKGIRSNSVLSIGYRELYEYFDNKCTLEEAIDKIKQHSRNFAKRQYTWFKNQMNVEWFDVSKDGYFEDIKNRVNEFIKK